MEKYDVVVIGGGLGSLTTATYLSKRLRNVAVFEENKQKKLLKYSSKLKDPNNNSYNFDFYHHDLGGVHKGDLLYEYIHRCGLEKNFTFFDNDYAMVIDHEKRVVKRPNDIKNFVIYLVRRYPKQRNEIHKFFGAVEKHYADYRVQKMARLNNEEYTIPSILIEWGDLSLLQVLKRYFKDENLMNEFTLVYDTVGLDIDKVHAYNYFMKFFDTFIDGSHFLASSFKRLVTEITKEISKTREKIFTGRKIDKFVFKDNEIHKIIDSEGIEIKAKHYVINMRIDDFVEQYIPSSRDIREKFEDMYTAVSEPQYINQVYVGLGKPAEELGINETQYIFSKFDTDEVRINSIMNYKKIDPKSCKDGLGAILIEFIDIQMPRKEMLTKVLDQFVTYFPKVKDNITVSKIGVKRPYLSGLASKEYWEDKTINDLFDVDDYTAINPFSNAYFIGSWLRPEAGITGMIQSGVEYGDIIDDLIYRGDDDDYFITHDELMVIISNQFFPGGLGKEEHNIQFFVGKDSYYIRTKAKHIRLYQGVTDISDIIIIGTNECLYDLSVGNTTLEKAIDNGSFEYVGERKFLDEVIDAFDMGIEEKGRQDKYSYTPGQYGIRYFLAMFGVLVLSNLLANYHYYLIVGPITLGLLGIITYLKYKKLNHISVFDILSMSLYFVISIITIFSTSMNTLEDSSYTTLLFAVVLLSSWLINKPILFGYIKYDYRTDYTRTKLFKKMAGGLTFIWGLFFAVVSLLSFSIQTSYSSLAYYLAFFALYLMFYYPTHYIKGNIE